MKVLYPIIFLLMALPIHAQDRDMKFHHLTAEDGLPSNTVNAVIRDSRGFMWIATENGVSRYDGYGFVNFRSSSRDTLHISSNITYVVLEDRQHRIWVGSEKGLDLFNRDLDRFDQHFFRDIPVRAIYQDRQGRLWVGTDDGLYRYDASRHQFTRPFHHQLNTRSVAYNTIPTILEDRTGNLWIGTSNGIYVYDVQQAFFRHYARDEDVAVLKENNVRKMIEAQDGRIWIATYGGGLQIYDPQTQSFSYMLANGRQRAPLSSNLITSLWEDEHGRIWMGTDGSGLEIYDPRDQHFQHVTHSPYNAKSLNNNVVRSLYSDGRGGVWIGTYNGGVNFYHQHAEAFFHYKVPTRNGNSSVTALAEEDNGNLWIGTDGGGLAYFDRQAGQFQNFYADASTPHALSDNRIMALCLDHAGDLWIGTYLGGLCRYDRKRKVFKQYKVGDRSRLSDNVIWCLLEDHRGQLWLGSNRGLMRYRRDRDIFETIDISNSNLSNNMVRSLYEDRHQQLWVGTQDGLNRMTDDAHQFVVTRAGMQGLQQAWIRTITEDAYGAQWIGTLGGGLFHDDAQQHRYVQYGEAQGLPDNMISAVLSDEHSNLWISTGRGLASFNRRTGDFKSYSISDGLQDFQFNINAGYKTKRGECIFGGHNGFTLFVPADITQVQSNQHPPAVVMTEAKIFNKDLIPLATGSPLSRTITETDRLELTYDQSVITLGFAALNYIQPEKNIYAYRLTGFDDDWNYVGTQRSATYTNLQPGTYQFQVKAANNNGVWNEAGATLDIIILPPWWETWWFKASMAVLGFVMIGLVWYEVRRRVKEKIRIHRLIAELETKALIAQMNPHFIFNCLTSIQELIVVEKQQEAMHYLHQFSRLLRTVLQSSEKNFIALEDEVTLLRLYLELEAMRFDQQFHYHIHIADDVDTEEWMLPSFLLQPFVENALWHGLMHKKGHRHLDISFTLDSDDLLVCSIRDNGVGRAEAARRKSQSIQPHQSMGLRIIQERISLMKRQHGAVNLDVQDITDDEGKAAGTRVVVKIPLDLEQRSNKMTVFKVDQQRYPI